jgi:holin-like protein
MANLDASGAVLGRITLRRRIDGRLSRRGNTAIEAVRARSRGGVQSATALIRIGGQVGLLWAIFLLSNLAVTRLHLRMPANIAGMLLLLALLSTGVVKEHWVAAAAGVLTKHLAFFFIPIAVGLMDWGGLLYQVGHWLLLTIVVSSGAGMATSGGLIQLFGAGARAEACDD